MSGRLVTQQDDLSPFYWDLCIDYHVFPPTREQRNIVQLCTSCVHARVWCVIVNEDDADDDVDDDDGDIYIMMQCHEK